MWPSRRRWSGRAEPARRSCCWLYVVALAYWGDEPRYASLDLAIEAHRSNAAAWSGSALVREALHWGAYFDGIEAYALGRLGSVDSLGVLLAMGAGNLFIFYNVCLALSCFRIPRPGFVQARLVPRSFENVFAAAAVATFLYFSLLAHLDEYVARSSDPAHVRTRVEQVTIAVAERIDDDHYRPGTLAQIASARAVALAPVSAAAERFRREVDTAFERLEDEAVEEYLDWYYSLLAEYGRVSMMLQGRLEDYLTEQARQTFEQEKWYRSAEAVFETMLSVEEQARAEYERTVHDILDRNRMRPEPTAFDVTLTASLEDIVQPSLHQDVIPAVHRLGAAGVAAGAGFTAAGRITFVIVQKVTAKVRGKQVLKLAAKAPLKVAASKLAGAVVGGVFVGPLGSIAVDGALLELEEALSRDDFERELAAAIRQARDEFADEFLGRPAEGASG